jgi:hypothetical protein
MIVARGKRMIDPLKDAFVTEPGKPAVDRLPRRKILGQQAPCNPAAQHIDDRVHDLPVPTFARKWRTRHDSNV